MSRNFCQGTYAMAMGNFLSRQSDWREALQDMCVCGIRGIFLSVSCILWGRCSAGWEPQLQADLTGGCVGQEAVRPEDSAQW